MENFRSYPGKILLFGEYTILQGSKAFAIPYDEYSGNFVEAYDARIEKYLHWLAEQTLPLDKVKLKKWASKLAFDSDIPIGYGVGSSGAIVAATYDIFKEKDDLPEHSVLAEMEGFFHSKSSGLDPMVSYYKKAYILEDGVLTEVDYDEKQLPYFSLYDSEVTRSTSKLVGIYDRKMLKPNFADANLGMIEINNQIVTDLSKNLDIESYQIERLSSLQREWMEDFIPMHVRDDWDKAFEDRTSLFKLCGAGGGGFFLEFDFEGEE